MKQTPPLPESGVRIDNMLTMALQRKSPDRSRLLLFLLALLGTVSSLVTLLSMFSPPCSYPVVILVTVALLAFFCWHSEHTVRMHYTMLAFIAVFLAVLFLQRHTASAGVLHLLNAAYHTIYMTDWDFFEVESDLPPELCTTFLICMAAVPVIWLLSYAVMRYQNFFLSLLVTFPFVEIGFFFGISPAHLPAFGLFAFWSGMAAVQLAASGSYRKTGKTGFQRRRNHFFPVPDMRFLLPEQAGILTALAVLALTLVCEITLQALHYERPMKVKELRSDFQHYVNSIDLNDLSTAVPDILPKLPGTESSDQIELGKDEKRQFDNTYVSRIHFTQPPDSRIYLKYATYDTYSRSTWSLLPDSACTGPVFDCFRDLDYYPPEFLYCTATPFAGDIIGISLEEPNDILMQCIPYGFCKDSRITCKNDSIDYTRTLDYTICGGIDYEYLITFGRYTRTTVGALEDQCPPVRAAVLSGITSGRRSESVIVPEFTQDLRDSDVFPRTAAEAALLSACGYSDFVRSNYLTLPDSADMANIRAQYTDLLERYDPRTAAPSDTILELQLLRERLCDQVTYSLSPGKTPDSRDFVSYFLLENKKGYCTHYATAFVLLARMAGIPARYCEGYMIDDPLTETGTDYTTEILDSNAHAWCEVWIDSIGWIPFEATYSYFTPPTFITQPPTDPPTEPPTELVPVPTQESPVQPVQHTEPTTESFTEPTQPEAPEPPAGRTGILIVLIVLLSIGFLLLCIIAARQIALRRRIRALRDPSRAGKAAWHWFLQLLKECGADTTVTTAADLAEEARTACIAYLSEEDRCAALDIGKRLRYSPHPLSGSDCKTLVQICRRLAGKLYESSDPIRKIHLKWFRHYL